MMQPGRFAVINIVLFDLVNPGPGPKEAVFVWKARELWKNVNHYTEDWHCY